MGVERTMPQYSAGYVLFVRRVSSLVARRFDATTRQFTGDPFTLDDDVAFYSVSDTGRSRTRVCSAVV